MKRDEALKPGGFDEHERDTAQRAYPREMVESSRKVDGQATQKFARYEIEAVLRKESGTRAAVSKEDIARFVNRAASPEEEHERATVMAVPRSVIEAVEAPPENTTTGLVSVVPAPPAIEIPTEQERVSTSDLVSSGAASGAAASLPIATRSYSIHEEPPVSRLPGWVIPVVAIGVGIVMSLVFVGGFLLGRVSALH